MINGNEKRSVVVDTFLAENWGKQANVKMTIRRCNAALADNDRPRWHADATKNLAVAKHNLSILRGEADPFEAEYNLAPWKRYFLVTNNNGHVHREMNCSTCFFSTEYSWLVNLSDCNETEMVEQYGEMACTICFPAAPSMKGWGEYNKRQKAERAAVKAAAKAEKEVGYVFDADGKMLFKTERAASIEMVQALVYSIELDRDVADGSAAPHNSDRAKSLRANAHVIATALGLKTGLSTEEVLRDVEKKVTAKVKKNVKEAAKYAAIFAARNRLAGS